MREMDRERDKIISVEYRLSLLDAKTRKALMEGKWMPSKSLVKNFMRFLFLNLAAIRNYSVTKTDGSSGYLGVDEGTDPIASAITANGGVGNSNKGIVVGKGSTPVTNDDYALEEQCVHGEGTDQLIHSSTSWSLGTEDDFIVITAERTFTNNSGAAITLNEIGIYVHAFWVSGSLADVGTVMILRDVITALTVNHQQAAGVQYKIKTRA